jgi:uncharacterized delta-60 repeat protein
MRFGLSKLLTKLLAAMQDVTLVVMVAILVLLFDARGQSTLPREGDLDVSFSGDGKVITDFSGRTDAAAAIVIQPDGKILVAGSSVVSRSSDFVLARYLPNGALDSTFSGDGKLRNNFDGNETARAVALQPDGKIVVAGTRTTSQGDDFLLARYLPNGNLDTSFSGNGWVTTDLGSNERAKGVAVQPDGKIVAAGGWRAQQHS